MHSVRQSRVVDGLHETERRQRRLGGRLGDDGAASGQGRGDLPGQEGDRVVPWRHRRHHARRLPDDEAARVRRVRRGDLATDAFRLLRRKAQRLRRAIDLLAGVGSGFPCSEVSSVARVSRRSCTSAAALPSSFARSLPPCATRPGRRGRRLPARRWLPPPPPRHVADDAAVGGVIDIEPLRIASVGWPSISIWTVVFSSSLVSSLLTPSCADNTEPSLFPRRQRGLPVGTRLQAVMQIAEER